MHIDAGFYFNLLPYGNFYFLHTHIHVYIFTHAYTHKYVCIHTHTRSIMLFFKFITSRFKTLEKVAINRYILVILERTKYRILKVHPVLSSDKTYKGKHIFYLY